MTETDTRLLRRHALCDPDWCDIGESATCPQRTECAHPNVFDVVLGNEELPASDRDTGWECCDCGKRSWDA